MKKTIIGVIIIALIVGVVAIIYNVRTVKEEKLKEKYEIVEQDGYYSSKGKQVGGYIVGNKTEKGYKYGYINAKGRMLLELEYSSIDRIKDIKEDNNVYLIAIRDGRYGVTKNGKVIINYEYQFIEYNPESETFTLQKNEKSGASDKKGKIILPVQYDQITANGIYLYAQKGESKTVYSNNGKQVDVDFNTTIKTTENPEYYIEIKYEDEKYKYGLLDSKYNEKVQAKYLYLEYVSGENFIACNEEEKQGIINAKDEPQIEFNYDLVQKLSGKNIIQATSEENNETILYNLNLQEICKMQNATIEIRDDNTIEISNEEQTRYFDSEGNEIFA